MAFAIRETRPVVRGVREGGLPAPAMLGGLIELSDQERAPDRRFQRRHEEAVIPARQQAGDRARRVPPQPAGDQPLAALRPAQVPADLPSQVHEGGPTRPYTGIAPPWITSA